MIFTFFLLTFTGHYIHFVQVFFKNSFQNLKIFERNFCFFFWKIKKAESEGTTELSSDLKNDFRDDMKSSEAETSPEIEPNPDQFTAEISGKAYVIFNS